MYRALIAANALLMSTLVAACDQAQALEEIPAGTEVTIAMEDGSLVKGRLSVVDPETVVLTANPNDAKAEVRRTAITQVTTAEQAVDQPERREVTVPADTTIEATLETALASNTSRVEDPVRATLSSPLTVDGVTVVAAGGVLLGNVTSAQPSGKVKGRAHLGVLFDRLQVGEVTYDINTTPIQYVAEGTKQDDATKIGIGAAAGAIIGGIAGGGKGAAVGSAIGAGGGTAVVLATPGEEVLLTSGTDVAVTLEDAFTVTVPAGEDS